MWSQKEDGRQPLDLRDQEVVPSLPVQEGTFFYEGDPLLEEDDDEQHTSMH